MISWSLSCQHCGGPFPLKMLLRPHITSCLRRYQKDFQPIDQYSEQLGPEVLTEGIRFFLCSGRWKLSWLVMEALRRHSLWSQREVSNASGPPNLKTSFRSWHGSQSDTTDTSESSQIRRRLRSSSAKRPSKRQCWPSGGSGSNNAPMRRTLRTLQDLRSVWWCGPECWCNWRRVWSKKRGTHRRHCNFLSRCRQLWLNTASFVSSRNSTSLMRMNNALGYGSYRLGSQHHNSLERHWLFWQHTIRSSRIVRWLRANHKTVHSSMQSRDGSKRAPLKQTLKASALAEEAVVVHEILFGRFWPLERCWGLGGLYSLTAGLRGGIGSCGCAGRCLAHQRQFSLQCRKHNGHCLFRTRGCCVLPCAFPSYMKFGRFTRGSGLGTEVGVAGPRMAAQALHKFYAPKLHKSPLKAEHVRQSGWRDHQRGGQWHRRHSCRTGAVALVSELFISKLDINRALRSGVVLASWVSDRGFGPHSGTVRGVRG